MPSDTPTPTISVTINGDAHAVPAGLTVRGLLAHLGVPATAAVERNLKLVPRARHTETLLAEGDRLEVVHLVGGG